MTEAIRLLTKRTMASWNVLAMMSWMEQRNGRMRVEKRMLTVLTECEIQIIEMDSG